MKIKMSELRAMIRESIQKNLEEISGLPTPSVRSGGANGSRAPMAGGWRPGQLESMSVEQLADVMKAARQKGDPKEIAAVEKVMDQKLQEVNTKLEEAYGKKPAKKEEAKKPKAKKEEE